MDTGFQLFPEAASTVAGRVDTLYLFLCGLTAFFTLGIFLMILFLGLKYRRQRGVLPQPVKTDYRLEIGWTIVPLLIVMVIFGWSAVLFIDMQRPPEGSMEIHVIGKQWMWKIQHPTGRREINSLHVPTGRPIRLVMTSQDVIHSFFVPAFRMKQDVLPGRFTSMWFQATRPGVYHLFCTEYCGAQHSGMIGKVVVMEPHEYQAWLSGVEGDDNVIPEPGTPVTVAGRELFTRYGCNTCHGERAPTLAGLYGSEVRYIPQGGRNQRTTPADDEYLRESILNPSAKVVVGYQPIMPTYAGQLSEEQVLQLVSYIKSLRDARDPSATPEQAGGQPGGEPADSGAGNGARNRAGNAATRPTR